MANRTADKHQTTQWEGAFKAFSKAFERIKTNPRPAILISLVYLAVAVLEKLTLDEGSAAGSLSLLGYEFLLYLFFALALPTYALAIADGKRVTLDELMDFNIDKYVSVIAFGILYGFIIFGSVLLFIIPAIWTIAWFGLGIYVVVDEGKGPIDALRESKRLIQNHKAKVWGIIGVTILFSVSAGILSIVPVLGVVIGSLAGSLVTLLSSAATAMLFRWAKHQKDEAA